MRSTAAGRGRAQLEVAAFLFSPVVAGRVYAAVGDAGAGGGLLESDDSGVTWTDVADATYRATALLPYRLVVDGSGAVWVCLAGNGLLRGVPAP
jgi:photosystem II stability/assembly factor-like uncharacterized protein